MNFKKIPLYLFTIAATNAIYSQKPTDVLVTINDSIYKVADFDRLYNKNIDIITDASQKDVATYFEMYKLYKIKLHKAYNSSANSTGKFDQEFKNYRDQLAEKYFVNEKALEGLLNEAYERAAYEVAASHILIGVDAFSNPADTLKAYNKALEVKKEIENGLSFELAAEKYSDDLSARVNKGNLGYFSVFRMVYPFENAAYNTAVGTISMPIRTNFGYHLIQVNDKRPVGKTKAIAHILVQTNSETDVAAKKKIDEIYDKLLVGQNFDDLAFHFSDDIYTRDNYGLMGLYSDGNMDIKGLSDVVYNLNFKGAFSKPFLSQYGWHIVRVTDIKENLSRESLRENYLRRIKSDDRSKVLEKDLIQHLKEFYQFKVQEKNIDATVKLLDRLNMITQPKVADNMETNKVLATYKEHTITAKQVLEHIYEFPNMYADIKTDDLLVRRAFDTYSLKKLKDQYNRDLCTNFPEFKQALTDYKEGVLLFDLLEEHIWKATAEDTLAQNAYYDLNKDKYTQPTQFVGEVFVFNKKSVANSFQRALNGKYPVNEIDFPTLYKYQGKFLMDDKRLPQNLDLRNLGKKVVAFNDNYYVFLIRDIKESYIPNFDEIKSKVQSDYQNEYEVKYNKGLLNTAKIEVNENVLNQLIQKYHKKTLN